MAGLAGGGSGDAAAIRAGKATVELGLENQLVAGLEEASKQFQDFAKEAKKVVGGAGGELLEGAGKGGIFAAGFTVIHTLLQPAIENMKEGIEDAIFGTKKLKEEAERAAFEFQEIAKWADRAAQRDIKSLAEFTDPSDQFKHLEKIRDFIQGQIDELKPALAEWADLADPWDKGFWSGFGFGDDERAAAQSVRESIEKELDKLLARKAEAEEAMADLNREQRIKADAEIMKGIHEEQRAIDNLAESYRKWQDDMDLESVTLGWVEAAKALEKYARDFEKLGQKHVADQLRLKIASQYNLSAENSAKFSRMGSLLATGIQAINAKQIMGSMQGLVSKVTGASSLASQSLRFNDSMKGVEGKLTSIDGTLNVVASKLEMR